jgi:hypothetical protein
MPQAPRFHLDESVTTEIADGLRKRGRDCTTPKDAGFLSANDPDHLAHALKEGQVTITRDKDFVVLSAEGVEHAGIVFWKSKRHFGQLIKDIDALCFENSAADLHGRVIFL